jgi:hypothetical protein
MADRIQNLFRTNCAQRPICFVNVLFNFCPSTQFEHADEIADCGSRRRSWTIPSKFPVSEKEHSPVLSSSAQ